MLQPIRNQIAVKPFMTGDQTKGGLIVPDSCKKESARVEIVAVGAGTRKTPMQYKAGQIAVRVKDWGNPFEYNGETYYMMEQDAILTTIKN